MPYYDETKNRFNPQNRFIGDIEDGKRYPFGVYTKDESDARYAVKQTEADLAALAERVAALEYKDITIDALTATPSLCELGSTNAVTVSWSLSKAPTQQNINGTAVSGDTKIFTGVNSPTAYTLTVSDGKTSAAETVSVGFANRIYYGAAVNLSSVTELTSVLSDNPERTISVNAGTGEYIIYAIPARLGDVVFYVGGFEGGFENPVEQTLTNSSGYEEVYNVYRSTNAGLGETTVDIKEG